jgi:hypothetical protein
MEEEEVVLITRDSILFLLTIYGCIHGQDFLIGTSQKSNLTHVTLLTLGTLDTPNIKLAMASPFYPQM